MPSQKIVVNKVMNTFVSSFITMLFRPSWNPRNPDSIGGKGPSIGSSDLPADKFEYTKQPSGFFVNKLLKSDKVPYDIHMEYNNIHGCFLVKESFLTLIYTLQKALVNGTGNVDKPFKTNFVNYSYHADGTINWKACKVDDNLAALFGGDTKDTEHMVLSQRPKREPSSLIEILLRHLYSVHPENREMAFSAITEIFGGWESEAGSMVNAAKSCFIPLIDFNSDDFTYSLDNQQITMLNTKPCRLEQQYRASVHNQTNEAVYLYFPQIDGGYTTGFEPSVAMGSRTTDPYQGPFQLDDTHSKSHYENVPVLGNAMVKGDAIDPNRIVELIPFTAVQLGSKFDENNEAIDNPEGDIIYDYLDQIDYFDSIKIVIQTPLTYTN